MGLISGTALENAAYRRIFWRIVPFLFLCYLAAFLDRVNVGFAKLQMAQQLGFSDAVYGLGAGIFFIGYFFFEVPSNLILARVGARFWIARIMVSWGIISCCMMLVETEFWFYTLRFLLGVAEAGFFPGVILYLSYWFPLSRRARMGALFMTAIAISNVIGAPVSGFIMQFLDGANGWRGWQWLFLLEGLPSILIGLVVLLWLDDGPGSARWLGERERALVLQQLDEDQRRLRASGHARHRFGEVFSDPRTWALSFSYLCMVVGFYAVNFWMPTIIQELGIPPESFLRIGLLSMIPWGTAAVGMVLYAARSDRIGEWQRHTAAAMLFGAAGLLGLAFAGHAPLPSMIFLTMVTTGLLSSLAVFWSLPATFLSGIAAAAGIAWINSIGNLGGYFGPELIGRVRTATDSSETAFLALTGIVLLGALVLLGTEKRRHIPSAPSSPGG